MEEEVVVSENKIFSFIDMIIITFIVCLISYFLYDYVIGYICNNIILSEIMEEINFIISFAIVPCIVLKISKSKYSFIIGCIAYYILIVNFGEKGFMDFSGGRGFIIIPIEFTAISCGMYISFVQKICYFLVKSINKKKKDNNENDEKSNRKYFL